MSSSYQEFLKENNLKQPVMRDVTVGFSGLAPEVSLDSVTEQIENLKEQISGAGNTITLNIEAVQQNFTIALLIILSTNCRAILLTKSLITLKN